MTTVTVSASTVDKNLDTACSSVVNEIIGVRAGSWGPPGGRGSASQLVDRPV